MQISAIYRPSLCITQIPGEYRINCISLSIRSIFRHVSDDFHQKLTWFDQCNVILLKNMVVIFMDFDVSYVEFPGERQHFQWPMIKKNWTMLMRGVVNVGGGECGGWWMSHNPFNYLAREVSWLFFCTPSSSVRELLCKVLSQSCTQWAAVMNMHSWKKLLCLRWPVFWSSNILILRLSFPNFQAQFS